MAAASQPTRQFASNVKREMVARGLSLAEVAELAELSLYHLNLILRGERKVQLDTLVKLAGALGVPPERLLAGVEWVSDGRGGGEFRTLPEPRSGEGRSREVR